MKYSEISSLLKVNDYDLTHDELWINYDFDGKEMNLIVSDQIEIAKLLKDAGYIDDYTTKCTNRWEPEGLRVDIERDVRIGDIDTSELVRSAWFDFIEFFDFGQKEAFVIACEHEKNKMVKGSYLHQLPNIPDLIKRM